MKRQDRKRLVKEIKFKLRDKQTLVINYTLLGHGLESVVITNNNGIVEVHAQGRSRFEFSNKKIHPNACDFWLANSKPDILIEDIILSKFWSQFTWGPLFDLQRNRNLNRALNREIRKLVNEFEQKAAERLNGLVKKYK